MLYINDPVYDILLKQLELRQGPVSKYRHIGVRVSTCEFWENTIQSITVLTTECKQMNKTDSIPVLKGLIMWARWGNRWS